MVKLSSRDPSCGQGRSWLLVLIADGFRQESCMIMSGYKLYFLCTGQIRKVSSWVLGRLSLEQEWNWD